MILSLTKLRKIDKMGHLRFEAICQVRDPYTLDYLLLGYVVLEFRRAKGHE